MTIRSDRAKKADYMRRFRLMKKEQGWKEVHYILPADVVDRLSEVKRSMMDAYRFRKLL